MQIMGSTEPPTQPPEYGVYITGLQLCNADWDSHRACIQLPRQRTNTTTNTEYSSVNKNPTTSLPTIWLKPTVPNMFQGMDDANTRAKEHTVYACPLYVAGTGCLAKELVPEDEAIVRIDLPCTLDDATWVQKRVYAVSTM